jgi:hypothetical protein
MTRPITRARLDLHNASVDFAAAVVGRCGFTHLMTGRTCRLIFRHSGPCEFADHKAHRRTEAVQR